MKKPSGQHYERIRRSSEFCGWVRCLGWCDKKFYSPDKRQWRYCPKCRQKKDQEQLKMSGIRQVSGEAE